MLDERIIEWFINLVGESSRVEPLSWEPRFLLNKSLANDLVLTSGDFSECSDSEFSFSVLTERPLKLWSEENDLVAPNISWDILYDNNFLRNSKSPCLKIVS